MARAARNASSLSASASALARRSANSGGAWHVPSACRRGAEFAKMLQRGDAPGDCDHRVAAEREAGGADPFRIDPRHEGRVGKHGIDDRAQIACPLPPQRETRDRIAVDRIVAGVVDRGGDIPRPGQRRAQPGEASAGSAGAVRQHDQREFGWRRRERRIGGRAPAVEQRIARRAEGLWLLLRGRIGRIPDHRGQCVLCVAAPLVRLGRHERARRDADLERGCGLRRGLSDAEAGHRDKARQQGRSDHRSRRRHPDTIGLIKPYGGLGMPDTLRRM